MKIMNGCTSENMKDGIEFICEERRQLLEQSRLLKDISNNRKNNKLACSQKPSPYSVCSELSNEDTLSSEMNQTNGQNHEQPTTHQESLVKKISVPSNNISCVNSSNLADCKKSSKKVHSKAQDKLYRSTCELQLSTNKLLNETDFVGLPSSNEVNYLCPLSHTKPCAFSVNNTNLSRIIKETTFSSNNEELEKTFCYLSDNSPLDPSFTTYNSEDDTKALVTRRQKPVIIQSIESVPHKLSQYESTFPLKTFDENTSTKKSNINVFHKQYETTRNRFENLGNIKTGRGVFVNCSCKEHNLWNRRHLKSLQNHSFGPRKPTSQKNKKRKRTIQRQVTVRKTATGKRVCHSYNHNQARKNSALLAKTLAYKPKATLYNQEISDNFYSALITTIFCFFPLGVASLIYTYKVRINLAQNNREKAHRSSLIGRKLAQTGVMLGITITAFSLVYFFIRANTPYAAVEYDYYLPE